MVAGLAAIAVLDVERDAEGANITTFGDAVWWAATTVTTVGYGDRYPVTTEGRVIAVALMVAGIATVGAVMASIAAWMVAQVQQTDARDES
jgi:voltage-gated potassium channel